MNELADTIVKDGGHQSLESRGCIAITHLHHLAPECAKDSCKHCLMDVFWYNAYALVISSFDWYATWPYHCEWYLGHGMESHPWPCYCSVLIDQKQYVVYCFSSICRALAPLDVPLQVSTTKLWCISQFSERVLHRNALGISADSSGYVFRDQLNWSHGLLPR